MLFGTYNVITVPASVGMFACAHLESLESDAAFLMARISSSETNMLCSRANANSACVGLSATSMAKMAKESEVESGGFGYVTE